MLKGSESPFAPCMVWVCGECGECLLICHSSHCVFDNSRRNTYCFLSELTSPTCGLNLEFTRSRNILSLEPSPFPLSSSVIPSTPPLPLPPACRPQPQSPPTH
ncbi:hypothetical protein E2C01_081247 [Portunus trituberculatus]|uniref:Uncharacterized protein n=1 Tax=Portunus trituberculatus TaxID=210409 RepID=A0A5B7ILQ9_PORTR|nr:hypothetical protein [Portunus trituberculatus]